MKGDAMLVGRIHHLEKMVEQLKKRIEGQKHQIQQQDAALKRRNICLAKASEDYTFLKKRVVHKYGSKAFLELLAHVECPGGFDIQRFKESHSLE